MYFANIYVSILNIFTDGVEATLDVPSLLVKPGLLGKGCLGKGIQISQEDQAHQEMLQFHSSSSIGGRHRDLQDIRI